MSNKTKTLIFFIFLSIFALLVFLINKNRQKVITENILPLKPSIPNYIKGELEISFVIDESKVNIPEKLPMINLFPKKILAKDLTLISKNLGFEGEPSSFKDVDEGMKYYWNNSTYVLNITPQTSSIIYENSTGSIPQTLKKGLSEIELKTIANSFLEKVGIINLSELEVVSIDPLTVNQSNEGLVNTTYDKAQIFSVNYRPKTSNFQILTIDPGTQPIHVQILPDGQIYRSKIFVLENLNFGISEYNLKNYNDIINKKNEAKIVNISDIYATLTDFSAKDLSNIEISNIDIVYLIENLQMSIIQPVFLLKGTALVNTFGKSVDVLLYLPAFK